MSKLCRNIDTLPSKIEKGTKESIVVIAYQKSIIDFELKAIDVLTEFHKETQDPMTVYNAVSDMMIYISTATEIMLKYLLDTKNEDYLNTVMNVLTSLYNSVTIQTLFLTEADINAFKARMRNIQKECINSHSSKCQMLRRCICEATTSLLSIMSETDIVKFVLENFPQDTIIRKYNKHSYQLV